MNLKRPLHLFLLFLLAFSSISAVAQIRCHVIRSEERSLRNQSAG
jgi:hypothetical protein